MIFLTILLQYNSIIIAKQSIVHLFTSSIMSFYIIRCHWTHNGVSAILLTFQQHQFWSSFEDKELIVTFQTITILSRIRPHVENRVICVKRKQWSVIAFYNPRTSRISFNFVRSSNTVFGCHAYIRVLIKLSNQHKATSVLYIFQVRKIYHFPSIFRTSKNISCILQRLLSTYSSWLIKQAFLIAATCCKCCSQ